MPYKVMLYSREQKLLYCAETRERKRKLQSTGGQRSMEAQQARALICQGCSISRYSSASVRLLSFLPSAMHIALEADSPPMNPSCTYPG